jgi:hypothetical protein
MASACADAGQISLRALPNEDGLRIGDEVDVSKAIIAAALTHPAVTSQWPEAHFNVCAMDMQIGANYYSTESGRYAGHKTGRTVTLAARRGTETLASGTWTSRLPGSTNSLSYEWAYVDVTDLLTALFSKLSITQTNLERLVVSPVQEIGIAAARNLHDKTVLARIADMVGIEIHNSGVTGEVLERIDDQTILADFATGKRGHGYGKADAIGRLTDRSVLERIAREDENGLIRQDAAHRLSVLP